MNLKKLDGRLKGQWVGHGTRDEVVDYVHRWSQPRSCPPNNWFAGSVSA